MSSSHEPRVRGGCSLFAAFDPALCPRETPALPGFDRCGFERVVDCCGQVDEHDVVECSRCGRQKLVACTFDEDYS